MGKEEIYTASCLKVSFRSQWHAEGGWIFSFSTIGKAVSSVVGIQQPCGCVWWLGQATWEMGFAARSSFTSDSQTLHCPTGINVGVSTSAASFTWWVETDLSTEDSSWYLNFTPATEGAAGIKSSLWQQWSGTPCEFFVTRLFVAVTSYLLCLPYPFSYHWSKPVVTYFTGAQLKFTPVNPLSNNVHTLRSL